MPDSTNASFWTAPHKYAPKAQFRFKVTIGGADAGFALADNNGPPDNWHDQPDDSGGFVWYAKTVDKPGFQLAVLGENMYDAGMSTATISPAVETPTFKKVSMTLIDPSYPNATRKLLRLLRRTGYNDTGAAEQAEKAGGAVNTFFESVGLVQIEQLDQDGKSLEIWTLIDAFPAEVDFGTLSYASDDLVEIKIVWSYSTFKCEMAEHGGEQNFTYFKDPPLNRNLRKPSGADPCAAAWAALGAAQKGKDEKAWKAANCP